MNIEDDMGNAQAGNMGHLLEFAKFLEKKNKKKICEIAEKLMG